MRTIVTVLLLVLSQDRLGADEYRVVIDPADHRLARVEANLSPTDRDQLLLTRNADDSGIDGGWARFLEELEVHDATGVAVAVGQEEEGAFRLARAVDGPVTVRYTMRLGHDRVPNLPGADELAWARPEAVLWTGRALFLEGAPAEDIDVVFDLPEGWRATTPWQVVESGRSFRAADTEALLDSAFIAGTHFEAVLGDAADSRVRIALAGSGAIAESERIVDTVRRYLETYSDLHGAPPDGRLLLVAADGSFWGGGVMGTTISMMLGGALDEATLPMLRFVTVHELFHLWNANFRYAGETGVESLYWLTEGTASYYTLRSQLGHGELSEEQALGQLADEVGKYLAARGDLSMVAAGPEKLHHYDLIYSGGFAASMALDIAVRAGSDGIASLDDVMRSLASGAGRRESLDAASLPRVIESTTGVDVGGLVECCIGGSQQLPLVDLFARLGLDLRISAPGAGETPVVEISRQPSPSPEAAAMWAAWPLGG